MGNAQEWEASFSGHLSRLSAVEHASLLTASWEALEAGGGERGASRARGRSPV